MLRSKAAFCPLLAIALALGCKREPSAAPAPANSAPSASSSTNAPLAYASASSAVAAASAAPPFVAPPPTAPAKPIVAKEGEALATKADCAAFGAQYSRIMSGYFDEPTHASCGPATERADARKEMLPMFAEQARELRQDCEAELGWRYDKADAACFLRARSTVDWRACSPRTPFFADAIGAVPYACEKPAVEVRSPDADEGLLAVRTAPRVLRAGDCDPLANTFVDLVRARAATRLSRCMGPGSAKQLAGLDVALVGVRDDVVKQCKDGVGGLYAGRDRLCFELAKASDDWGACGFSTPLFRSLGETEAKLEPTYEDLCKQAKRGSK